MIKIPIPCYEADDYIMFMTEEEQLQLIEAIHKDGFLYFSPVRFMQLQQQVKAYQQEIDNKFELLKPAIKWIQKIANK